jgi:hypothetical protein
MSRLPARAAEIIREEGIREFLDRAAIWLSQQVLSKIKSILKHINHWKNRVPYNPEGMRIFEQDWDNLIILDACRFDKFVDHISLNGSLQSQISRGSTTKEWIRGNFEGIKQLDTVYISDNPWYGRLYDKIDSELYYYHIGERDAFSGAVTHPTTMTDNAIEQVQRFPNKRVIIHYLQPHAPWFDRNGEEQFDYPIVNPYAIPKSRVNHTEIEQAYEDSLALVLEEIERLLEQLDGKTVITADHGELLNDTFSSLPIRGYGHPEGIYVDELVKIPWFVLEHDKRKNIEVGSEAEDWHWNDPDKNTVEKQLKSLGYLS